MHLLYMCAFIYEDLRKLSPVYAHLYVHLYASSVYVHIRNTSLWKWPTSIYASSVYAHIQKRTYTKCTYTDDAYTEGAYMNDAYTEGPYTEEIYCNPNASSVYVCFHR